MQHPLDRTLNEMETGYGAMGEYEYEGEGDFEYEADGQGEWGYETDPEAVFDEVEEMELAAALLEVSSDQEMEQFLGKLVKKVGGFVRSPIGRALGGALRSVAKVALPAVGTALGGPVGGMLASTAGKVFGLELEGMSPQDQEFEAARRFVRLAGASAQKAARARPGVPPTVAAKDAVLAAARQHAPGLVSGAAAGMGGAPGGAGLGLGQGPGTNGGGGQSGRWIRKGDRLILFGA